MSTNSQRLCLLLLLGTIAAASALDSICGPRISFFPTDAPEGNIPTAWGRAAQQTAGNSQLDEMLPVALTSTNNAPGRNVSGVPMLQVSVSHPLLTVGASPNASCVGSSSTPLRRLMQVPTGSVFVTSKFQVSYRLNNAAPVVVGQYSAGAVARVNFTELRNLTDGYYCATIIVDIMTGTGRMNSGTGPVVPLRTLSTQRQVCFYKMDQRPTADVNFKSCGEDFQMVISNLRPQPVELTPGSNKWLFQPVYYVWADFNRTKDGSWPDGDAPKSIQYWYVNNAGAQSKSWSPEDPVAEGWYSLNMETSLFSAYPGLIALGGRSSYDDSAPEDIAGKAKFLGQQIIRRKQVGIQNSATMFQYLDGPVSQLVPGVDTADFKWTIDGLGETNCSVDGVSVNNVAISEEEKVCQSPLSIPIAKGATGNQTLEISMQDVCNNTKLVEVVFGPWGYKLLTKPDNDDGSSVAGSPNWTPWVPTPNSGTPPARRNAGSRPSSSSLAAALTVVAVVAAMFS